MNNKLEQLAKIVINHSIKLKKGEIVMINSPVEASPLILELYKQIISKGAFPITKLEIPGTTYQYYKNSSIEQLKQIPEMEIYEMKRIDAWIRISSPNNLRELSKIDPRKITTRKKAQEEILKERLKKKWVIVAYPTPALAQEANMSNWEFENFVFNSCIQDWNKISKKFEKIRKELQKAEKIRVESKDTNLEFSNKGRKWVIDDGIHNMPGGEIFTAPVETSVKGHIQFNIPSISDGKELQKVYLEFKNGKIIKATAEKNQEFLKELIKTDKGSSYLGECGIGTNYKIKNSVKQILFDEKIGGTIHFAIGAAYPKCGGKNKSSIHIDFIKDLRKDGKVYADGKLIQNKGKFLI